MTTWERIRDEIAGMLADGQPLEDVISKLEEMKNPKPMTNEEWLRSATTEQLVIFLAKQKCEGCNDEPYDEKHGTCKYCMTKKTEQVREWLKQPHHEKE